MLKLHCLGIEPGLGAGGQAAIGKLQRGQRVRRHHSDVLRRIKPRRVGVHDKGGNAARAGLRVGFGEHAVVVGDAAVADPGLAALQGDAAFGKARRGGHGARVRAGLCLAQGKGGNHLALRHGRQVAAFLRCGAGQGNGAAAQALHGKSKVGQGGIKGQGFAQDDQRA